MKFRLGILLALFLLAGATGHVFAQESSFLDLALVDYGGNIFRASSSLEDSSPFELGEYGMQAMFDHNRSTGWSEGENGSGIGVVLWLRLDAGDDILALVNGFARNERFFAWNNRIQSMDVSFWQGFQPEGMVSEMGPVYIARRISDPQRIEIADCMEVQYIPLSGASEAAAFTEDTYKNDPVFLQYSREKGIPSRVARVDLLLRMEITEVYPGSRWDDTCITELRCGRNSEDMEIE